MNSSLQISTVTLSASDGARRVFDMSGRCAFALCTKGSFDVKILDEVYAVTERCIFACMPFVNIEVVDVHATSEVIFGYISIEAVSTLINRWVNTANLAAIQNRPLVRITEAQCGRIMELIAQSVDEYHEDSSGEYANICDRLQRDIIEFQSMLLVAHVLKVFFSNISINSRGHTHRDIVFQRFILSLYIHFREHRDVRYYAGRSGVSLKYFSTVVRQQSGKSPSEWIETVVVGEARTLLNDAQWSIKDIAANLNFPDTPTFTKYFSRVTGMTPKAYRHTFD